MRLATTKDIQFIYGLSQKRKSALTIRVNPEVTVRMKPELKLEEITQGVTEGLIRLTHEMEGRVEYWILEEAPSEPIGYAVVLHLPNNGTRTLDIDQVVLVEKHQKDAKKLCEFYQTIMRQYQGALFIIKVDSTVPDLRKMAIREGFTEDNGPGTVFLRQCGIMALTKQT